MSIMSVVLDQKSKKVNMNTSLDTAFWLVFPLSFLMPLENVTQTDSEHYTSSLGQNIIFLSLLQLLSVYAKFFSLFDSAE